MRTKNWEVNLFNMVEDWRGRGFSYGTRDCCAFVGACVRSVTAVDYFGDWEGEYTDARSAALLIKRRGFKNLKAVLISMFGNPVPVAQAFRGDIVYSDLGMDAPQLGICLGIMTVCWAADTEGLIEIPTLMLQEAFNV